MTSPIDSMIDQACGVPPGWKGRPHVTLFCHKCNKTKRVPKDDTDPPNTARVETLCPECCGGDFSEVLYFDASGKQILEF